MMSGDAGKQAEGVVEKVDLSSSGDGVIAQICKSTDKPSRREENTRLILELIEQDPLVGYPSTQPSIDKLNHGWFYTSNQEVLAAMVNKDTGIVSNHIRTHIFLTFSLS